MKTQRIFLSLISLGFLFLSGCHPKESHIRVGIDRSWYSLSDAEMQPYLSGYIDELLLTISKKINVRFECIYVTPDNLLTSLFQNQCDLVLTSLPDTNFNRAKYSETENVIDLGPVWVIEKGKKFSDSPDTIVGILDGASSTFLLLPKEHLRFYDSPSSIFAALTQKSVDAIVVARLLAVSYLQNLQLSEYVIHSPPLTKKGIRFVALKGRQDSEIKRLNEWIQSHSKKTDQLRQKWHLQIAPD